jgi:hypothetical protein
VHDDAFAEEGVCPALGAVDYLVRYYDVLRLNFLFQAAHGAHRDDPLHSERLERPDVGLDRQLRGQDPVSPPVPGKEGDPRLTQRPHDYRVARIAEWRLDSYLLDIPEPVYSVESASAYDT